MDEPDDFDSPWKDVIQHALADFMAFYFPAMAERIDWACGHEFLETELRQVVQDAELGRRHADLLARVTTHGGQVEHVYIHVEVQGGRQSDFEKRMFVYHYRLFDRFDAPVASLAVLADDDPAWRPNRFVVDALGLQHTLEIGVAKLLDHEHRLEDLTTEGNPFALVTAAHLLTRRTRGDDQGRYEAKRRLIFLLYRQGWERQQVLDLLAVLDWMMRLPPALTQRLWQDIDDMDEEKRMRYVTTWEQRGIEKGWQAGMEKGIEKGMDQGLDQGYVRGEASLLERQLVRRFGPLSEGVQERLATATRADLETWGDRILDAQRIEDVFFPGDSDGSLNEAPPFSRA
jgi:Domain of unknown function (DUF4351)